MLFFVASILTVSHHLCFERATKNLNDREKRDNKKGYFPFTLLIYLPSHEKKNTTSRRIMYERKTFVSAV